MVTPTPLRHALSAMLAFLLLGAGVVHAQDQTVSGTVTDGDTGDPLPGVNVTAPGTALGPHRALVPPSVPAEALRTTLFTSM